MRDIVEIVETEIVNNLDNSLSIVSVSSSVGVDTLTLCDVKWAREGKTITDSSSNTFTIGSVDYSANTMIVTGDSTFSDTIATLEMPLFFDGTPLATNEEWGIYSNDERLKVPFIWMLSPTNETLEAEDNVLERRSAIRVVFLDSNNTRQWLTGDTRSNRMRALYNLLEWFIKAVDKNTLFNELGTKTVLDYTKFGTETPQGFQRNIIDADLTGLELRLELPVLRDESCTNC